MSDVGLSQEEIDNLLKGDAEEEEPAGESSAENSLSELEADALGELFNISMGTAATTLSNLIGKRVEITTPRVTNTTVAQLKSDCPLPYVVADVKYVEGLEGNNLLIIKIHDAAVIVDLMMGGDGSDPSEDLDEIALSAVGEAMNQMIGSGATSISAIFGEKVNISPPTTSVLNFASEQLPISGDDETSLIKVVFNMYIEELVESEMMQLLPVDFARQISRHLLDDVGSDTAVETEAPQEAVEPQVATPITPSPEPVPIQPPSIKTEGNGLEGVDSKLSMILDVPLKLLVELGRTRKTIGDLLDLGKGSIVELDKFASEPVDIYINGKSIAKGEIVVIGDNYGVRITEIQSSVERVKNLRDTP